jgi:hypothetical protein
VSTGVLKRLLDDDEVAMELAITALCAFPDLGEAAAFMEREGYGVSPGKMAAIRNRGMAPGSPFHDRFVARKEQLAPKIEGLLAGELLDEARFATNVARLALETTETMLKKGRINDPSRVARDLSQIRTQAVDKRLALQGRPTQIQANRSVDELVRALEGLGVARQAALDVPDAEVVEVGDDEP